MIGDLITRLRRTEKKLETRRDMTRAEGKRYSVYSERAINPDGPEAANALEAQAKRIEELETAETHSGLWKLYANAIDALEEKDKRITELYKQIEKLKNKSDDLC